MKIFIGALVTLALAYGAYYLFALIFAPNFFEFLIAVGLIIVVVHLVRRVRRGKKSTDLASVSD